MQGTPVPHPATSRANLSYLPGTLRRAGQHFAVRAHLLVDVVALAVEQAVEQLDGRLAHVVRAVLALQVRLAAHREHDACAAGAGGRSSQSHALAPATTGVQANLGENGAPAQGRHVAAGSMESHGRIRLAWWGAAWPEHQEAEGRP